jgi:hypothetical protein
LLVDESIDGFTIGTLPEFGGLLAVTRGPILLGVCGATPTLLGVCDIRNFDEIAAETGVNGILLLEPGVWGVVTFANFPLPGGDTLVGVIDKPLLEPLDLAPFGVNDICIV